MTTSYQTKIKEIIDDLKAICSNYGLGNDAGEYIVITQSFLYKFLNDKFAYEIKNIAPQLEKAESWEQAFAAMTDEERFFLTAQLSANSAVLKPDHLISTLASKQNEDNFAQFFDDTMLDIALENSDIFSVMTTTGAKEPLFEALSEFVSRDERNAFCKAIINKLTKTSFEHIFNEKYDFYATIFEYLIKDYNNDSGGVYAEYYTPHSVAKIMAQILVPEGEEVQNVKCYDPSAGSGTLLMNLAHAIGEDKCSIYSQDQSKKSSRLLRLNLILNNLVHSLHNVVRGNTILTPYHKESNGELMKFDYIVSNPPFKLDFSDWRDDLDTKKNQERFFAGIPNIPKKAKNKMAIYELFFQHIMYSMNEKGKAAIVVPTGFITAQSGIDKKIRQALVKRKMLKGVVSMPSNIFATTGTNVSIVFLDKENQDKVVLIDASNLGIKVKEGKNQKTLLSAEEEQKIIDVFNHKEVVEDLSVVVSYDEIKEKNYSLSAGQYFEIKIEYVDITAAEFDQKMNNHQARLHEMFAESHALEKEIMENFEKLKYEQ